MTLEMVCNALVERKSLTIVVHHVGLFRKDNLKDIELILGMRNDEDIFEWFMNNILPCVVGWERRTSVLYGFLSYHPTG
jgi:hypothetical protein